MLKYKPFSDFFNSPFSYENYFFVIIAFMIKDINKFKQFYKHVLVCIIIIIIGSYSINFTFENDKDSYLEMQTEIFATKYETNYNYFKIMSKDIYSIYKDNNKIINLVSIANDSNIANKTILRDKLYSLTKKRYKRLLNMGVLQIHFHLKDNTSFLRLHKPNKFGDDLTLIRPSVVAVNTTQKMVEGFEVGKIIHGFRFVYPLFYHKKHVGSMEVSFSSEKLMEIISNNRTVDSHFLVSQKEIDEKLFPEFKNSLYAQSIESPDYLIETRSHRMKEDKAVIHSRITSEFNKIVNYNMSHGNAFSVASKYNEESSIGSFIPVKNMKHQTIAYIVFYTDSDYLDNIYLQKQYITILFFTIVFLLFIFSIYITLNNRKLQIMAHYDKLTSLSNRAHFYIRLEEELRRVRRSNTKVAVLFIDLDGFKAVNDTFGHNIGDQLLVDVSRKLVNTVREVDIVARLGGDEFVIALLDVKHEDDILRIANNIIANLNEEFVINKNIINIGASIGISLYPDYAKNSDEIIKQSDDAMYEAKNNGKNHAIMYKNS